MSQVTLSPVVATCKIDGTIPPGKIFVPASEEQLADLEALGAVREPTEAEVLLYEKMLSNEAAAAKPAGRSRKPAQPSDAEAAAAAEAEAKAKAEADAEAEAKAEAEAAAGANIG